MPLAVYVSCTFLLNEPITIVLNRQHQCCAYLDGDAASRAAVVHEDSQHVRDQLGQVKFKLSTESHHDLLDQQNDGVLHWVVWSPVFLQKENHISQCFR